MHSIRWGRWLWTGGLAVALVATWGAAGSAQSAPGGAAAELKTAVTHAGFAAKYDSLKEVTLHLHMKNLEQAKAAAHIAALVLADVEAAR